MPSIRPPDLPSCLGTIAAAARDIATGAPSAMPPILEEDPTRRPMGWKPSNSGSEQWVASRYVASNPAGDTNRYRVFSRNLPNNDCSASSLAYAFKLFAHESLHDICPPHSGAGSGILDGALPPKPDGPAPKPDCAALSHAALTAAAICGLIDSCHACLTDCPKEDVCPPLETAGGVPIEGTETCEKIGDLCKALSGEHKKMQNGYNTAANVDTAFDCKCGSSPYSPGPAYPDCPEMPSPPGGCQGSASESYPNNKVIPDCDKSCPQPQ